MFMILEIFSQSAGKMNDLLFPAWDVRVFCIFSGTTLRRNRHAPSSVTVE